MRTTKSNLVAGVQRMEKDTRRATQKRIKKMRISLYTHLREREKGIRRKKWHKSDFLSAYFSLQHTQSHLLVYHKEERME